MPLRVALKQNGEVAHVTLVSSDDRTSKLVWQPEEGIALSDTPLSYHHFRVSQGPNTSCSHETAEASMPAQAMGLDVTSTTKSSSFESKNCVNQLRTSTEESGVTTIHVVVNLRQ